MPQGICGRTIFRHRIEARANGYGGTVRIAKSNAWRAAIDPYLPFMGRERQRWSCPSRCRRGEYIRWTHQTRYGRPVRRANNTFRISCVVVLRLKIECPQGHGHLAALHGVNIGPFASKDDAILSQQAAVVPPDGAKTGFFHVAGSADADVAEGYYYTMYLSSSDATAADEPVADDFDVDDADDLVENGEDTDESGDIDLDSLVGENDVDERGDV